MATDSSGNNLNGTLYGFANTNSDYGNTHANGWTTSGLKFAGPSVADYVKTGLTEASLSSAADGSFTIQATVQYTGSSNPGWTCIIGDGAPSSGGSHVFYIGVDAGNTHYLDYNLPGPGAEVLAAGSLFNGQSHLFDTIYNGASGVMSFLVDGTLVSSTTRLGVNYHGLASYSDDFYIGGNNHAGEYWNGTISGVSFSTGAVPEPSTYALFGLGSIGMLMVLLRKKAA